MKATKRFATVALAVSLAAGLVFAARADQFIKDVLLIGGTSGETYTQKTNFMAQGWTFIDYDLNKGAGGDYVYLMYKTANTPGCNACYGYITEFYIKDSGDAPDT